MMKNPHRIATLLVTFSFVAVSCLALSATQVFAAGYHPVGEWQPVSRLTGPTGVTVALDGEVFVADSGGARIAVYDSTGALLREFDGRDVPGEQLVEPLAAVLGPDALLYVADRGTNRISVFERSGSFVRSWGGTGSGNSGLSGPFGLAFSATGHVLVADRFNNRVQVFTNQGAYVRTLATVNGPSAVAVHGNDVYVAEATDMRVRVFQFDTGAVIKEWGLTTSGSSTTSRYSASLSGLMVDAGTGRVYVSDAGRNLIERCDPNSVPAGSVEVTIGPFAQPAGMALSAGSLYVADKLANRVARMSVTNPTAVPTTFAPAPSGSPAFLTPRVVAAGPDGSLYVAETGANRVRKFDAEGRFLITFDQPALPMSSPSGILADHDGPAGEVYVSDTGNNRLLAYSPDGRLLAIVGSVGTGSGQYMAPQGLSKAFSGYIAVADTGNRRIQLITPAQFEPYEYGVPSMQQPFGSTLSSPTALIADTVNFRFLVSDAGKHSVVMFNSGGERIRDIGAFGSAPGSFFSPHGIASDVDGSGFFVADTNNDRVQKFSLAGQFIEVLGSRGYGRGGLMRPTSVAVMPDGQVVVADTGNNRVVRFGYDSAPPAVALGGDVGVWVSRSATISVTATDTGSGVALVEYQVRRPSGAVGSWITYRTPFVISDEGTSVVAARATDRTGNVAQEVAFVTIDLTAPSGTAVFAQGTSTVRSGVLSVLSSVASATEMRLGTTVDPGAWVPYATHGSIAVSGEGTKTLRASYRDLAGNTHTVTREIVVDDTGPVTTIGGIPTSGLATRTVTVTVGASDAYSPVTTRKYRLNGGAETTYTAAFAVTGNRAHTVEAWAIDSLGNVGSAVVSTFTISELSAGGALSLADGASVVGTTTTSVSTTARGATEMQLDTGSGFGGWMPVPSPWRVTFASEGTATLNVRFRDGNGIELGLSDSVVIDLSPPVTTIHGVPARGGSPDPVTLSFIALDRLSEATCTTIYTVNGGPPTTYVRPVTMSADGAYSLHFRSFDRFGHAEETRTASFVISRALPTGTFSVATTHGTFVGTKDLTITNTVPDAIEMRFRLNDADFGDWVPYSSTATLTAPGEGIFWLDGDFRSISGIESQMPPRRVDVDLTSPRISSATFAPRRFTVGSDGVVRTDFRFTTRGKDPEPLFGPPSGVSTWSWRIGRARTMGPAATDVPVAGEVKRIETGYHRVSVHLFDRVGNAGYRTGSVRVAAGNAPTVPTSALRNKGFTVSGRVPVAGANATYALQMYRRDALGRWVLYKSVATRPVISGQTADVRTRVAVGAGSYRAVLYSSAGLNKVMGRPSRVINVN